MASSECRMIQEQAWRQQQEQRRQQRVPETLLLSPPPLPPQEECMSPREYKEHCWQYKNKLRKNRIVQVRAQEALWASQRVTKCRDRTTEESRRILNHLKDVWRDGQRRRIASLEEEFAKSCRSIGLSHQAAQVAERNRAAMEELVANQAAEGRCWDALRFEEAIHKERELRELREKEDCAPSLRRQFVESVADIERSFSRRYKPCTKPKPRCERKAFACFQTRVRPPPATCDDVITQRNLQNKLGACLVDFQDTHLRARLDHTVQQRDRGRSRSNSRSDSRSAAAAVNHVIPEQAAAAAAEEEEEEEEEVEEEEGKNTINAWRAADARRESFRSEKANQVERERVHHERKIERGYAAVAKLLNDQRLATLEHEVEEAFRREEREKDRAHAALINHDSAGTHGCPSRAATDGPAGRQSRRVLYNKHKISNPLSCPGLPHSSRTCSRCRSCVELIPPPVNKKEPTAEYSGEPAACFEPDFTISVQ